MLEKAELFCTNERDRIELENQPQLGALAEEASQLLVQEKDLRERLRNSPRPGELRTRKMQIAYYWVVAIVLTGASVAFVLYSFAPFGLGPVAYLYCLGIAASAPFLLEHTLRRWSGEWLVRTLSTTACAAAILGLMFLASVRGQILAQRMLNPDPSVVIDDNQPSDATPQNNFYVDTVKLLQLVMMLLAFSMDLGAGLALHEAWWIGMSHSEDWQALRKQLDDVLNRKITLVQNALELHGEPTLFVKTFWSNFYRATLTRAARNMRIMKALLATLGLSLLLCGRATAQTELDLVIAVDLSKSVAVRTPGQPSEFEKNIDGVAKVLAGVSANSRITIIGITDQSFSQPCILLSARVPADPGYFGERLVSARAQLVRTWKQRSQNLQPLFPHTDIVGALYLASQVFDEGNSNSKRTLVIFSDMRQDTRDMNLEAKLERSGSLWLTGTNLVSDLGGVEVHVLGVDNARKDLEHWKALREFWRQFFEKAGADLKGFSVLRKPTFEAFTSKNPLQGGH